MNRLNRVNRLMRDEVEEHLCKGTSYAREMEEHSVFVKMKAGQYGRSTEKEERVKGWRRIILGNLNSMGFSSKKSFAVSMEGIILSFLNDIMIPCPDTLPSFTSFTQQLPY